MRITGGRLAGRKIAPPLSLVTRPMMDRVRQALFNILAHHDWGHDLGNVLAGGHVLDAFCGTGALGFEALSWGSEHATLFDLDRQALTIAMQNAASLGVQTQCDIVSADTLAPPRAKNGCKLVFLAPPYRKDLIPAALVALEKAGWFAAEVLIVAETAKNEVLELPAGYQSLFRRGYGEPLLHFIVRPKI